jgi:hypothetical protein
MPQPPLLPEAVFARVVRLATTDGLGIVIFAGMYAFLKASDGQPVAAILGLLATGAGAMELHGTGLLRHGEPRGITWLIACQPFLWCVIMAYCGFRLLHFQMPPVPDQFKSFIALSAEQWNMTIEEYARFVDRLTIGALALIASLYQGWMTWYFFTRRHAVSRALGEE